MQFPLLNVCVTPRNMAGKPFELIDWQEQIIRDIGKIGTCGCSGTASDLWRVEKREVKFMAVRRQAAGIYCI